MAETSPVPGKHLSPEQLAEIRTIDLKQSHVRGTGWANGAIAHRRWLLGHIGWLEQWVLDLEKKLEELEQ
jgi:hypothetical protein